MKCAQLLDEMGVDSCVLILVPEGKQWEFQRSEFSGKLQMTSQMVGPVWRPLEGGPWVARLMRPSRQPVPHATYRNFYVAIGVDEDTPLVPGGQVRFPIVPGAPAEGIVCNVPSQWGSRCKQLVFPLKLNKNGCSANQVTINAVEFTAAAVERGGDEGSDHLVEDGARRRTTAARRPQLLGRPPCRRASHRLRPAAFRLAARRSLQHDGSSASSGRSRAPPRAGRAGCRQPLQGSVGGAW